MIQATKGGFEYVGNEADRFFEWTADVNQPLIHVTDKRNIFAKIWSVVVAFFKFIIVAIQHYIRVLRNIQGLDPAYISPQLKEGQWAYDNADLPWMNQPNEDNDELIIYLHGLNTHPCMWETYLEQTRKEHPNAYILAPFMKDFGNCSVESAAKPVIELIDNFTNTFKGKKVTIIGTSNGARIGSEVLAKIKTINIAKLDLGFVAGLHYGTSAINWLEECGLLPITGFNKDFIEEARWGNPVAQKLLDNWKNRQIEWNKRDDLRVRVLFATTLIDDKIDAHGCLPIIPGAEVQYKIYNDESHQTIVFRAQKRILQWMKSA